VLAAPRNADVPAHLYEGRGNVKVEFVPNEVGELCKLLSLNTVLIYIVNLNLNV